MKTEDGRRRTEDGRPKIKDQRRKGRRESLSYGWHKASGQGTGKEQETASATAERAACGDRLPVKLHDCTTARLQDCMTARLHDCKTPRRRGRRDLLRSTVSTWQSKTRRRKE